MSILEKLKKYARALPISRRFGRDLIWNVAAVGILAFSGLAISLGIGREYGPSDLGLFNQTFAIYIVAAQLAVSGFQLSVVKHVAQHRDSPREMSSVLTSALLLTLAMGAVVSGAVFSLRSVVSTVLGSPGIARSLAFTTPGILLFALNKVLLHYLNGRRHMRAYAVFQSLRYIALFAGLVVCILLRVPGDQLAVLLPAAEAIVFLCLGTYVLRITGIASLAGLRSWIPIHLRFGLRALPAGVLTDLNTRIDVLLLGVFASDHVVGVYSLAAMFAQGLAQLPYILMVNVNPIVSRIYHSDKRDEMGAMLRRGVRLSYVALAGAAGIAVALYPIVLRLALQRTDFAESWTLFAMIGAGIALAGGYLPFLMVLNQTGHPGSYTLLLAGTGVAKAALCAILIPTIGVHGAAAASGASFIVSALLFRLFARRNLGIRL